jgi:hypothetical protein
LSQLQASESGPRLRLPRQTTVLTIVSKARRVATSSGRYQQLMLGKSQSMVSYCGD